MSYRIKIDPRSLMFANFAQEVRDTLVDQINGHIANSGLTKAQLADRMGVHKSVVTRGLRGDQNLTLRSIVDFCWALGVRPVLSVVPLEEQDQRAGTAHTLSGEARMGNPDDELAKVVPYDRAARLGGQGAVARARELVG